jgi:hypothetical protein
MTKMFKIKNSKRFVGAVAVLLLSLMAANSFILPAHAATAGTGDAGTILFPQPSPPSGTNMTQVSGVSPQTSSTYGCLVGSPENTVTQVNAQVALDQIAMGSNSFNNWMGLGAVSDLSETNVAEVGISVYYQNGWQTPFLYFSSWYGGKGNNFNEQTATPSGLTLGQTIGIAVAEYQSTWSSWYNLNNGAGWKNIANRTLTFSSTSYVFSSCESTIASGIKGNIMGQWSGVNYQQNGGTMYTVYFQSIYANTFNHFTPENYQNNNSWYGEYTATG